ncbi:YqaE/Pmp3 family membrane protein [Actomonas aquatica]|uniref:YqaE/Pmp3 family membrane protein n=1 Tax=Actomonas aquatica TaxID=2866162 RepID=A0ABZ1C3R9_9BACT|nr:YqaE/Pmp3 family membrane protein [Opitutus sp. WL0086]WRQ86002.1 YqaE/Pmp3 family membrane protein [Opitutus sp. WL0086]
MLYIFLAICFVLPPCVVAIRRGFGLDFGVNLLLTLLLWVPGAIHAFAVVLKSDGTKSIA